MGTTQGIQRSHVKGSHHLGRNRILSQEISETDLLPGEFKMEQQHVEWTGNTEIEEQ